MQHIGIHPNTQKRSIWIFFVLLLYYALGRLSLIWRFGDAAFGYDTGIYRRITLDYITADSLKNIPAFAFGYIAKALSIIGLSVDAILIGGYVAISLLCFTLFFIVVTKHTNRTTGYIALFLYSTSLIQFDFFWWYYYRNSIAILCTLWSLLLLEKKSWWRIIPLTLLVSIHPLTAIPVFITYTIYSIQQKQHHWHILVTLFLSGLFAIGLNWEECSRYLMTFIHYSGVLAHVDPILSHELDGQFITTKEFLKQSIFYLPFALVGLATYKKKYPWWTFLFLTNLFLVTIQFLLYKRFFILLDLSLIFFAACIIETYIRTYASHTFNKIAIVIFSCYMIGVSINHIDTIQPLISNEQILEIQLIEQQIPAKSTLLSFTSVEAPWLLGFAGNHTIIAPGIFDANKWDYNTWTQFWSSSDIPHRHQLLKEYHMNPMYIVSLQSLETFFATDPYATHIAPIVWHYHFPE